MRTDFLWGKSASLTSSKILDPKEWCGKWCHALLMIGFLIPICTENADNRLILSGTKSNYGEENIIIMNQFISDILARNTSSIKSEISECQEKLPGVCKVPSVKRTIWSEVLNLFLRTVNEGILALFLSTILFVFFFLVAIVYIKMSRHDALVITSMEEETLIPAISHIGKLS